MTKNNDIPVIYGYLPKLLYNNTMQSVCELGICVSFENVLNIIVSFSSGCQRPAGSKEESFDARHSFRRRLHSVTETRITKSGL